MEDICASIRITAKKSGKFTTIFRKKLHKKLQIQQKCVILSAKWW